MIYGQVQRMQVSDGQSLLFIGMWLQKKPIAPKAIKPWIFSPFNLYLLGHLTLSTKIRQGHKEK